MAYSVKRVDKDAFDGARILERVYSTTDSDSFFPREPANLKRLFTTNLQSPMNRKTSTSFNRKQFHLPKALLNDEKNLYPLCVAATSGK